LVYDLVPLNLMSYAASLAEANTAERTSVASTVIEADSIGNGAESLNSPSNTPAGVGMVEAQAEQGGDHSIKDSKESGRVIDSLGSGNLGSW